MHISAASPWLGYRLLLIISLLDPLKGIRTKVLIDRLHLSRLQFYPDDTCSFRTGLALFAPPAPGDRR